jgi:large subunit ribosomal protein L24
MFIRKGDMVQVITGDTRDHGKVGKVLTIQTKTERLVVEGVNIIKRHTKPTSSNQSGGIVEKEASIHASNVMPWCESESKASPIIMKRTEDGQRVRIFKINGETVKDND